MQRGTIELEVLLTSDKINNGSETEALLVAQTDSLIEAQNHSLQLDTKPTLAEIRGCIILVENELSKRNKCIIAFGVFGIICSLISLRIFISAAQRKEPLMKRYNDTIFDTTGQKCSEMKLYYESDLCDSFMDTDTDFHRFCANIAAKLCSEITEENSMCFGLFVLTPVFLMGSIGAWCYFADRNRSLYNLSTAAKNKLLDVAKRADVILNEDQSLKDTFDLLKKKFNTSKKQVAFLSGQFDANSNLYSFFVREADKDCTRKIFEYAELHTPQKKQSAV